MVHNEIREKFLKFFESRGHKLVPSSSLLPTDPSVLFTTAGMQQFKPYYTGQADAQEDFGSLNAVSIQKCIRTSAIGEVGDESHLTFFEMLGNFSFGGYWKKEAIEYAHEFITKELGLNIDYVSVFEGENGIPADTESEKIWKSIDPTLEVRRFGREDNFWGPTGEEGPCGPSTEVFVKGIKYEIWNIVFNEFYCSKDKKFTPLDIKGIDTGMGLERLTSAVQNKSNIFETDLFEPLMSLLPDLIDIRKKRVISDHLRAAVFLLTDGVLASNKEQGYILRRLLRRAMVYENQANLPPHIFEDIIAKIIEIYGNEYSELKAKKDEIMNSYHTESNKFMKALSSGIKELQKTTVIDSESAFKLYESYGLPFEVIKEVGAEKASSLTREGFEMERKRHQEISRAGAEKKFGGHGIVEGDLTAANKEEMWQKTRLHTATHIIVAALKKVLKQDLPQAGSDINAERLRFDFTFPRKLTDDELREAEKIANQIVEQDVVVTKTEMPYEDAIKSGAAGFFKLKYPPMVKVFTIGPDTGYFSREICGGPHVSHTAEIGRIKITKEESVSGGNRRIRAVIE